MTNKTKALLELVAKKHGLTVEKLLARGRRRRVVRARWAAYSEMRSWGWSYPRIAREFGKDHTTIMHGVKQAAKVE